MRLMTPILILLALSTGAFAADKYVNTELGFEMVVPAAGNVSGIYQHCMFYLPTVNGFSANVNLQVQEFAGTLEEYKAASEQQFKQAGIIIVRSALAGGSLSIEYKGTMQNLALHWFARALKKENRMYLITATALETRWSIDSPGLVQSVNSFRLK